MGFAARSRVGACRAGAGGLAVAPLSAGPMDAVPRSHPEPPVAAEEGLAPSISSLPQAGAAPGPQPPRVQMQLAC